MNEQLFFLWLKFNIKIKSYVYKDPRYTLYITKSIYRLFIYLYFYTIMYLKCFNVCRPKKKCKNTRFVVASISYYLEQWLGVLFHCNSSYSDPKKNPRGFNRRLQNLLRNRAHVTPPERSKSIRMRIKTNYTYEKTVRGSEPELTHLLL